MTFFDLELNVRLILLALCSLGVAESLRARGPAIAPVRFSWRWPAW